MSASAEMPRYKSHKEVWALKIEKVEANDIGNQFTLYPAQKDVYAPFDIDARIYDQAVKSPGGYYVVYDDGYKSFSPAKAFEEGYTQVSGPRNKAMTGYDDGVRIPSQRKIDEFFGFVYAQKFLAKPGEHLLEEDTARAVFTGWEGILGSVFRTVDQAPAFSFEYTCTQRGFAAMIYSEFVKSGRKALKLE